MDFIPPSGYYYPNKIARIFLLAMEEIMGKNGLNAVLNMAKQPQLIDNYPPDSLDKAFDFAQFSALNAALEEMYGPRGGRGLALRGGRAACLHRINGDDPVCPFVQVQPVQHRGPHFRAHDPFRQKGL